MIRRATEADAESACQVIRDSIVVILIFEKRARTSFDETIEDFIGYGFVHLLEEAMMQLAAFLLAFAYLLGSQAFFTQQRPVPLSEWTASNGRDKIETTATDGTALRGSCPRAWCTTRLASLG